MTKKVDSKSGNFRTLTEQELELIAGGSGDTIVVTGGGQDNDWDWSWSYDSSWGASDFYDSFGGGAGGSSGEEEPPIVVTATRPSATSTLEVILERDYVTLGGDFGDATQLPNGEWHIVQAINPTEDQLEYKHNLDQIQKYVWNGALGDVINQKRLASFLADYDVDLERRGEDIAFLYTVYDRLLDEGHGYGTTMQDFAAWVSNR